MPNGDVSGLAEVFGAHAPVFAVRSECITFLDTPAAFHAALVDGLAGTTRRAALSALYIGAEDQPADTEARLHAAVRDTAARGVPLRVLMDHMRGTRYDAGVPSPAGALAAALGAPFAPECVPSPCALPCCVDPVEPFGGESPSCPGGRGRAPAVHLYMTPALHGAAGHVRRALLPGRVRETLGLQHMKFAVLDDAVIVAGANMARPYFVDRTDRYVLVRACPPLADYFWRLSAALCRVSHAARWDGASGRLLVGPPAVGMHESAAHFASFMARERAAAQALLGDACLRAPGATLVCPAVQMAPHGVRQDEAVLGALMAWSSRHMPHSEAALSTGYMNVDAVVSAALRMACPAAGGSGAARRWRVVTAGPRASVFYGAPGLAGRVPGVYRSLAHGFLLAADRPLLSFPDVSSAGPKCPPATSVGSASTPPLCTQATCEVIYEVERAGWTFHAKGLWLVARPCEPRSNTTDDAVRAVTAVGSSNYGHRSVHRDLEAQLYVATADERLAAAVAGDMRRVFEHAVPRTAADLAAGAYTGDRLLSTLFRSYF